MHKNVKLKTIFFSLQKGKHVQFHNTYTIYVMDRRNMIRQSKQLKTILEKGNSLTEWNNRCQRHFFTFSQMLSDFFFKY